MKTKKNHVKIINQDNWCEVYVNDKLIHSHHTIESDGGIETLVTSLGATFEEEWKEPEDDE